MDKPICLITGATDGIGKVTATALARKGYAVVLAARNEAKAATVTTEIVASTGNRDVDYLTADLRSLAQLHRLAETFTLRYPRLDVLINNAGIIMPQRALTEDGYETTFQVNYLSQFYLTHLLLNELNKSPRGRVINLSSSVYRAGKFDPDNLQSERPVFHHRRICRLQAPGAAVHHRVGAQTEADAGDRERRASGDRQDADDAAVHGDLPGDLLRGAAVFAVPGQGRRHLGVPRLLPGFGAGLRTILHARQGEEGQDGVQHAGEQGLVVVLKPGCMPARAARVTQGCRVYSS